MFPLRIADAVSSHPRACPDRAGRGDRAVYLEESEGDAILALHRAVADALTDLCEAERRTLRRDRLISHGYVRRRPDRDA